MLSFGIRRDLVEDLFFGTDQVLIPTQVNAFNLSIRGKNETKSWLGSGMWLAAARSF